MSCCWRIPWAGALALTIVLAVFLIVEGIFKIMMAMRVRDHSGWGWLLASGVLSVILGVLIWAEWPASGLWVIGLLVGIQLLFTGWSLVMLALAARAHRQATGAGDLTSSRGYLSRLPRLRRR